MDKIDGPYHFFKLIHHMRRILPPWMPALGIEGGRINLVPVGFVVAALDDIAHLEGEDGTLFPSDRPAAEAGGRSTQPVRRGGPRAADEFAHHAALLSLIPRS